MGTAILCIGTLDSKGTELQYLKELLEKRGYTALVLDISTLGKPLFTAEIPAEEVARAAGNTIQKLGRSNYLGQRQRS